MLVPHTYQEIVATLRDGDGLSARVIMDHLGHDLGDAGRYRGRQAGDLTAASMLDALSAASDSHPKQSPTQTGPPLSTRMGRDSRPAAPPAGLEPETLTTAVDVGGRDGR